MNNTDNNLSGSVLQAVHMAYCGFDCGQCPMYIATVTDDDELREKLIDKFSTPQKRLSIEDIRCLGCKAELRYRHPYCTNCDIRSCAQEHNVAFNCGECSEYPCTEIIAKIPPERIGRRNMDAVQSLRSKTNMKTE